MGIFDPDVKKLAEKEDIEGLMKAMVHKKKKIRESASEAISKISPEHKRLEICLKLTELLLKCDWFRRIDIVRTLGKMRCGVASPHICELLSIALQQLDRVDVWVARPMHRFVITDTDEVIDPPALYGRFVHNAVTALGEIGDPGAKDTLESVLTKKGMPGEADTYASFHKAAKLALDKIDKTGLAARR